MSWIDLLGSHSNCLLMDRLGVDSMLCFEFETGTWDRVNTVEVLPICYKLDDMPNRMRKGMLRAYALCPNAYIDSQGRSRLIRTEPMDLART